MTPKPFRLPSRFVSPGRAEKLNGELRRGSVALDWGQVLDVSDAALEALAAGLDYKVVAPLLGLETARPGIVMKIAVAFEKRPRLSEAEGDGDTPPPKAPAVADDLQILSAPSERELREELQEMVIRDLLGPAGEEDEEIDESRVRDRYLVGMLAPARIAVRPEQMDRLEVEEGQDAEDGDADDAVIAVPTMFPSAIGLSFCVLSTTSEFKVRARWGCYRKGESEGGFTTATGRPKKVWKRRQVDETVTVALPEQGAIGPYPVGREAGEPVAPAEIRGIVRDLRGTRVVSLFLVNKMEEPEQNRDEAWIFQPELSVEAFGAPVFVSRSGGGLAEHLDSEERILAMGLRNRCELAVGHGVSVHAELSPDDPRRAVRLATQVVPEAEVRRQESRTPEDDPLLAPLCLDMKELAESSRGGVAGKLAALPDAYEAWIGQQSARIGRPETRLDGYEDDARAALSKATGALSRIREGIRLIGEDEAVEKAFLFANRAMWLQRIHTLLAERRRQGKPATLEEFDTPDNRSWRLFQLGFILLTLPSLGRLDHPDRGDSKEAGADLLWFPTGGGKTEAYLGLAAFTMALRRLKGEVSGLSGMAGVAVLMRYTLRLLTLQQFQRASALICACEILRREDPESFGEEPFRIGLWVGSRSTPNRTAHADEVLRRSRDTGSPRRGSFFSMGSPVQLKSCPWCGAAIEPGRHMKVESYGSGSGRTLTFCGDKSFACPFTERHSPREGLPVVVVDEEIYRRLPALLIATVDKFAQMPWNGIVQMLFGHVEKICDRHGFSASDLEDASHPKRGSLPRTTLRDHPRLRPPDLIIQDELHLISGPLGTMTGLYETAVDSLCSFDLEGKRIRPKIVASTATIRRAEQQIHALFLRTVRIFPPQGLDAEDNFFAMERSADWGRRYIGFCAPGKRLKAAVIRVYVALLAAAQHLFERYGSRADPFMTLVGYFSSLRELAGTRRLVDDDISSRLRRMDRRGLARRRIGQPWELTSRLGSIEIPALLDRLERRFEPRTGTAKKKGRKRERAIDVLLATNMISVGVDVRRLGLMVALGQPKNTAEYIQATSRVGRAHPGMVCTIYNWARPRDLSHYETFEHYHRTFYRKVEALSVTPFALRSIDRGLSAVLVALVRLTGEEFSRNEAAADIRREHPIVANAVEEIARRAELVEQKASTGRTVRAMLERRLDEWIARATRREGGTKLGYRPARDSVTLGLLEQAETGAFSLFTCTNSLRNVEATVDLILEEGLLAGDTPPFREGPR